MTKLVALLAAALVIVSGCTPSSLAQGLEETSVQQAQVVEEGTKAIVPTVTPSPTELPAQPEVAPPSLWMDMSMGAELIDWFNATAHASDIARADHVSRIDMLEQIEVGKRLVVFRNVADAEALLPRVHDKLDVIGYNLEHGPANREDRDDPIGSVKRMRELADEYGKELALGPDRTFAMNNGVGMAPYVDIFVLQVQKVQEEPDVVRNFVLPLSAMLRAANPEIEISVQVRTEGDPHAIASLIQSMEPSLDGVSILTNPDSTDIAEAIVAELRSDAVIRVPTIGPGVTEIPDQATSPLHTESVPTAPATGEALAMVVPTAASTPRRSLAATVAPGAGAFSAIDDNNGDGSENGWLFLGVFASVAIFLSGLLVTSLMYAVRKARMR